MINRASFSLLSGLAIAGLVGLTPKPALACGGFFCSFQQPVNQQAERILFIDHEDGSVTAVIQIQYAGPSESFSWVLPVFGEPEVGVSSNVVFNRLQQATNPQYSLTTEIEGTCASDARSVAGPPTLADADGSESFNGGGPAPQDPGVSVLAAGAVGPYDYTLIGVDPGADDPADVAVTWLEENGYDVSGIGEDLLRPYLASGMNLVAFKLQKEASSGEIRPVTLEYSMMTPQGAGMHSPLIPIQLTGVAAEDDMGVMVFHAASDQAVPVNYRALRLNEAVINWFNPATNYADVINLAADEAGGHGFVTERAGPMSEMEGIVWSPSDQAQWDSMQGGDLTSNDILNRLWTFAGWDGVAETLREHANLPDDATGDDVSMCPTCFVVDIPDPAAFIEAMRTNVIEPVQDTAEVMMTRPYFTRMYTTMSAHEMTEDPIFGYNPALEPVDNVHTATRVIECNLLTTQAEAPWRVALPQGHVVRGVGQIWPYSVDDMPANHEIVQQGRQGPGEVIESNHETISEVLSLGCASGTCSNLTNTGAGCTCASPATRTGAWVGAFALGGLLLAGRRRRR